MSAEPISHEDRQALIILVARTIHRAVRVHMDDAMDLAEEIVEIFHPNPARPPAT